MKHSTWIIRLALLAVCSVSMWAQSTAQITGTVKDASGSAVPGADIKVTQTETGLERTATSSQDGVYVLPKLPVGPYRLQAGKQGFETYVQTGIVLQVASNPVVDVSLTVGGLAQQVEVQANAALVETQATGVGQVIENQRILELPLNGRDSADLIGLTGAAVQAATSSTRAWQGQAAGEGYSIAGGTQYATTFILDGALFNNPYDNYNLPLPFPDALQEFKVETSALTAQNGVHSGAAVTAVVKSGTNALHGDAFYFLRNGVLDARNFFSAQRDSLKRNQYGGTLGGPVIKNKLFLFGGYQGTKTRSTPNTQFAFVPTPLMLQGDFTTYASNQCQTKNFTLPAPFVNNKLPVSLLDPVAVNIVKKLPTPTNACGQVPYQVVQDQNEQQIVVRGDYQLSQNQTIFAHYIFTGFGQAVPYSVTPNPLVTTGGGDANSAHSATLGDTYLIGANFVNAFTMSFNRTNIVRPPQPFFGTNDVGIQNFYDPLGPYMNLTVTGGFSLGSGVTNQTALISNDYLLRDSVSWVKGSHQFVFGGEGALYGTIGNGNVRSMGVFSFGTTVTGLGLSDFMLGKLASLTQSAPNTLYERSWYMGFYAQDTWKVSSRLTVNYGIRWEPWFPPIIPNGDIYNYSYARFAAGIKTAQYTNAPAGVAWPGDPSITGGNAGFKPRWNDFGPRLGISWDPKGDGKTVIRAGAGIFYDNWAEQFYINTTIAPPFGNQDNLLFPAGGLDNPYLGQPGGNPFPLQVGQKNTPFTPNGALMGVSNDPNGTKPPTVDSWNLTIQKQIGESWLLSASYLGSKTSHLVTTIGDNVPVFLGTGPCTLNGVSYAVCSTTTNETQRRPAYLLRPADGQLLGSVDEFASNANASYQGLNLSVQRRLANNVSATANYTWSHCITTDYNGDTGQTNNVSQTPLDPNNLKSMRGDCALGAVDQRQIFNLTVVAQTPKFSGKLMRTLASGWQAGAIFRYHSGNPVTITDSADNLLNGLSFQKPNLIGNAVASNQGSACANISPCVSWFTPTGAFAVPAPGVIGNTAQAEFRGPSYTDLDMSLTRNFQLRESLRMTFRVDAFNLPNAVRLGNPGANISTSTFGIIQSASDPRILQVSTKFIF